MSMFAVILNEPNETVVSRIEETYPEPNHLQISPTAFLVSGDLLVEDVTSRLGFSGDAAVEGAVGVVLRLNGTYGGRTYRTVWDWLARAEGVA